jgi:hypothetical protein
MTGKCGVIPSSRLPRWEVCLIYVHTKNEADEESKAIKQPTPTERASIIHKVERPDDISNIATIKDIYFVALSSPRPSSFPSPPFLYSAEPDHTK